MKEGQSSEFLGQFMSTIKTEVKTVGIQLGRYRVVELVGTGGLGRVFRALDSQTGQTVAIKLLHEKFTKNSKFIGIFHRELLIMSRLHHKHIVSYLDSYFKPPKCYIVTAFVEGWSGHAFMRRVRVVPPIVAVCILIDMLQGIDHLHLHDTVHSDLSAANFMIDKSGRVFVADFGLSCQLEIEDYRNYMIGTPGYYSPEHISEQPILPQTDLYCAGLILYEMLTGEKAVAPVPDRNQILSSMKRIDFSKVVAKDRRLQSMLRMLLKGALEFHLSRRTPSADVMITQCYEILRSYNVRYTKHAICRFLIDAKLVPGPFKGKEQAIYAGTKAS